MITDLLTASVTLSLAIMGLWICFNWQGMIFEPVAYHAEAFCYRHNIPHYVLKPLWACPTCMASVWGIVFYLLIGSLYFTLFDMLIILPMTAFLNTLWCILLTKTTDEGCG